MAMMAITTSSSIRVNPRRRQFGENGRDIERTPGERERKWYGGTIAGVKRSCQVTTTELVGPLVRCTVARTVFTLPSSELAFTGSTPTGRLPRTAALVDELLKL